MNYQVLARKYRPKDFTTLAGQTHVTQALINALNNNKFPDACLFTGTRGVGKTTIARIIAKCLNCLNGVTATPCGTCSACVEIDNGNFVDLLEIDAASHTRVEDVRDILDNIQYAPSYGRYKIYLIDEVHMLSNHSFNALLKTLEEPPLHVKFLLATTEPQKLPATILSRCIQFSLKALPQAAIAKHLATILTSENIAFEDAALQQIAKSANGSVRDALSILDQAIAFTNQKVNLVDVNTMLGNVDPTFLFDLLTALANNDGNGIFAIIEAMSLQAVDFGEMLSELISLLHKINVAQLVPEVSTDVESSARIEHLSKLFSPEDIQLYYQIALFGKRDLPYSPTPRLAFEMVMLRMLAFIPVDKKKIVAADPSPPSATSGQDFSPRKQNVAAGLQPAHNNVAANVSNKSITCHPCDKFVGNEFEFCVSKSPKGEYQDDTSRHGDVDSRFRGNDTLNLRLPEQTSLANYTQAKDLRLQPEQTSLANHTQAKDLRLQSSDWQEILANLELSPPTKALAANCVLRIIEDSIVKLALSYKHAPLLNKNHESRLNEALTKYFAKPTSVQIEVTQEKNLDTPFTLKQNQIESEKQEALQKFTQNANVQMLLHDFDATIIKDSIHQTEE
jgi:DNA polymerase-3 subunit gamma/tau